MRKVNKLVESARQADEILRGTKTPSRAFHVNAKSAKPPPGYEQDDGPLSAAQVRQIKGKLPRRSARSVRSNLIGTKSV